MAYNYVVSALKATAVSASVIGNFTSPTDINLLVAKNSRVEIYKVTAEGLKHLKDFVIYGQVTVMKMFRPPDASKDRVLILTPDPHYDVMILECETGDNGLEIITKGHWKMNIGERALERPLTARRFLAVIDPNAKIIVIRLSQSLQIIPIEQHTNELKVVSLWMGQKIVYDIAFLYGCDFPTLIFFYRDIDDHYSNIRIKVKSFDKNNSVMNQVEWKLDNVETEPSILIPVPTPLKGVISIFKESIGYYNGTNSIVVEPPIIKQSIINCYSRADSKDLRYLLGSMSGKLFMLELECEEKATGEFSVKDIKITLLGEISIPKCITYLYDGIFFIGSLYGDSQLVKLNIDANDSENYVSVMKTFTNLGPIHDMCVIDQGQAQMITCSGSYKEGSLRIIRYCYGIKEQARIDLPGSKDLWALKVDIDDENFDNVLVITFIGYTRILKLVGEEVEETEMPGLLSDQQTLYCANVYNGQILQVTPISARLISYESKEMVYEWKAPGNKRINLVASNMTQVVCASAGEIYYIEITQGELLQKSTISLEYEIACLDISPLEDNGTRSDLIVIGFWTDISVRILSLPDLKEIFKEKIGGEVIPRSILMANFEGTNYLLCGLGDGSMYYFSLNKDSGVLVDKKKVTLGAKPIILRTFRSLSTENVFVCCDQPTVIYSLNHKLIFSNINYTNVNRVCSLNAGSYPESFALATEHSVIIGAIYESPKINIRKISLGESPKFIAYQQATQTLGVVTVRMDVQDSTRIEPAYQSTSTQVQSAQKVEIFKLKIFEQNTFEVLYELQFMQTEHVLTLASAKLSDDPNTYYFVGTGFVDPKNSEEIKTGRILIYQYDNGKFELVAERCPNGGVYCLVEFKGKVLASIGSNLRLYNWTDRKKLRLECSYFNKVIISSIKTKGDLILLLRRKMALLQYKEREQSFQLITEAFEHYRAMAIDIIEDDYFLGAERKNVFVSKKKLCDPSMLSFHNTTSATTEILKEVGFFHVGDMVKIFRQGYISYQMRATRHTGDRFTQTSRCISFGTESGSIGIINKISSDFYDFFRKLEERLGKTIKPLGMIKHSSWRRFADDMMQHRTEILLDGDLIEQFLYLDKDKMKEVIKDLQITEDGKDRDCTVEDVVKLVEDLTRINFNGNH